MTISEQAAEARSIAQRSAQQAKRRQAEAAARAKTGVFTSAGQARVGVREVYQPPITTIKTEIEQARRQRYLPSVRGTRAGRIAEAREYLGELTTGREAGLGEVGEWEREQYSEIEERLMEGEAAIEASLAAVLSDVDVQEAEALQALAEYERAKAQYEIDLAEYEAMRAASEMAAGEVELVPPSLEALAPFKEGEGYNLVAALEAGITEQQLNAWGFETHAVSDARIQLNFSIMLEKFKADGGYDLARAIAAGWTDKKLLQAGFPQAAIDQAKITITAEGVVYPGMPPGGISEPFITFETPTGTEYIAESEWEAMPLGEQFKTMTGRYPTEFEYVEFALTQEGIAKPWQVKAEEWTFGMAGILSPFPTEWEKKLKEYQAQYREEFKKERFGLSRLYGVDVEAGAMFLSPIRALHPEIPISEISKLEWGLAGATVALLGIPIARAGIGLVGGKIIPVSLPIFKVRFPIKGFQLATPIKTMPKTFYLGDLATLQVPKVALRSPFKRITEGFYTQPITTQWPVKVGWGKGLQRVGLTPELEKLAFQSSAAAKELEAATKAASGLKVEYPAIGETSKWAVAQARLQRAIYGTETQIGAKAADEQFLAALTGVRLTSRQITRLERVTGYKGLEQSLKSVWMAKENLTKAWTEAELYRFGSKRYISALEKVEVARQKVVGATGKLEALLSPRFQGMTTGGWTGLIEEATANVQGASLAVSRMEKAVADFASQKNIKALETALEDLRVAEANQAFLVASKTAGDFPPIARGFKMGWEGPTLTELKMGGYKPLTPEGLAGMREYQATAKIVEEAKWSGLAPEELAALRKATTEIRAKGVTPKGFMETPLDEAVAADMASVGGMPKARPVAVAEAQLEMFELTTFKLPVDYTLKLAPEYTQGLVSAIGKAGYPIFRPVKPLSLLPVTLGAVPALISDVLIATQVKTKTMTETEFAEVYKESIGVGTDLAGEQARMTEWQFERLYIAPAFKEYIESTPIEQAALATTLGVMTEMPQPVTEHFVEPVVSPAEVVTEALPVGKILTEEAIKVSDAIALQAEQVALKVGVKTVLAPEVAAYPAAQILTNYATKLQAETLTRMQVLPATMPAARTATQAAFMARTGFMTRIISKPRPLLLLPPPLPSKKRKSSSMLEGLPLVATRQQGFVERAYYADSEDVKARSIYNPEEAGKPHDVLETFGDVRGIKITEDLGHQDVFMDLEKGRVRFEAGGLETDVGKRHSSKAKGMTIHRTAGFQRMA